MKLSIITINYNNSEGLERTINSIINQSFSDFEYLVIDGGSTDGSVDVISKYSENIDYWISESDSGVYNAMNKGIKRATGEYLLFINSGDVLINSSLSKSYLLSNLSHSDIIYFNVWVVYHNYCEQKRYPDKISMKYFFTDSLPHPATFIKRELFIKYGYYIETYKIISDWAFFFNIICLKKCTYKHIDDCISVFYHDGMSSKAESVGLIFKEKEDFYYHNLSLRLRLYKRTLRLKGKL